MSCTCYPGALQAEAGGSWIQFQTDLHSKPLSKKRKEGREKTQEFPLCIMAKHTCQWNLAPQWKNRTLNYVAVIFPETSLVSSAETHPHFQVTETHWEERRGVRKWGRLRKLPSSSFLHPGLHGQLLTSLFCSWPWEISVLPYERTQMLCQRLEIVNFISRRGLGDGLTVQKEPLCPASEMPRKAPRRQAPHLGWCYHLPGDSHHRLKELPAGWRAGESLW